jgi:hypothetical protein
VRTINILCKMHKYICFPEILLVVHLSSLLFCVCVLLRLPSCCSLSIDSCSLCISTALRMYIENYIPPKKCPMEVVEVLFFQCCKANLHQVNVACQCRLSSNKTQYRTNCNHVTHKAHDRKKCHKITTSRNHNKIMLP